MSDRQEKQETEAKPGISKVKLAVGAASLFLFIVGLKRTFQMDEAQGDRVVSDAESGGGRRSAGEPRAR